MPNKARFSRIFLKKEHRLPSDVRSRVVEALREILFNFSHLKEGRLSLPHTPRLGSVQQ